MSSITSRLCAAALATTLVLGGASSAFAQHHHGGNNAAGAAAIGLPGGLAVGAAIANSAPAPVYVAPAPGAYVPPATVYATNPHTDWCYAHTPGYNPYDNTYQGYYAGERVICRSPYGG